MVQPIYLAPLAIADYDVPPAAINMAIHVLPAVWALDPPIQRLRVERVDDSRGNIAPRPQVVDQRRENIHRYEHPTAAPAIQDALVVERGMDQRKRANRAIDRGGFFQNPDSIVVRIRNVHVAAIIANQVILVRIQRIGAPQL